MAMTNGPVHETAETARSIITTLGAQPIMLSLVIMNFALLGFLYWASISNANERTKSLELLYESRKQESDLLARCVIPQPTP